MLSKYYEVRSMIFDKQYKVIIDSYQTFECNKGHKWEETLDNRFRDLPLPINLPIPNGGNFCPFCLSLLLKDIGRVTTKIVKKE